MAKRVESPSSINTFKQCKRKYYYQYILNLPTIANIHQVRGNIAHDVLENFYNINLEGFRQDNYELKFREAIQQLFLHYWNSYKKQLDELSLNNDQKKFYFEETMLMLMNWVSHFINDLNEMIKKENIPMEEAFLKLIPLREIELVSQQYSVRGFVDAIRQIEEEIQIIDYKTNSSFEVKESIRLQLAIYTLLYFEKYGVMPSKAGIFFLRHKLKLINADNELLEMAKKEIEIIHEHTSRTENVMDYPQMVSPLCKWGSGQCDFYTVCQPKMENGKNGCKNGNGSEGE
jgi:ATP-dependent helicase/DNAse subunit B